MKIQVRKIGKATLPEVLNLTRSTGNKIAYGCFRTDCILNEKYKNVIRRVEMSHALIIEEIRKRNREKYIDEFF